MAATDKFNQWAEDRQSGKETNLDAPLGALETSKYKYSSFTYPLDLGAPGAGKDHYMVFHINESFNTQYTIKERNAAAQQDVSTVEANRQQDTKEGDYQTVSRRTQRVATTIVLYMPDDITTEYKANWGETDIGIMASLFDKITGSGSWADTLRSAGASALKNIGNAANEFTGLNLADAGSIAKRMVINNHAEVIFNGIGFRDFTFKFRMTPQSEEEAVNIDNIVRAFKFYAAPEIDKGNAGRYWIYPGEFDIQYFSNGVENDFLNKISTCALTNMSVNYTPLGHWAAHRPYANEGQLKGAPGVCTDISLTFKELEICTRKRVLEGY